MALEDEIALFAQIPLFEEFETEHLRLLAFGAERRTLNTGDILFREDDLSDCAYIVTSGRIVGLAPGSKLSLAGDSRIMESFEQGALIQPMALISNIKRPLAAMAQSKSELLRISRALFMRMLSEYPHLAQTLRNRIGSDLVQYVDKLDSVLELLESD